MGDVTPAISRTGGNDLRWNFIRNPLTSAQTAIGSSFTVLNVCRESYASYPFKECLDCGTSDRTYEGVFQVRSSLIEAAPGSESRRISQAELLSEYDSTVQDAVVRFGEIRLQVVTDGEHAMESVADVPHSLFNKHCRRRNSNTIADGTKVL